MLRRTLVTVGVVALSWAFSAQAPPPSQLPPTGTQQPGSAAPPQPQGRGVPPPSGQQPGAPGTPAPQTTSVPAVRLFTADSGVMFSIVKSDKTADFEAIMARVKEALDKSSDPKRKQQAQNWQVYKAAEPAPGGGVLYLWWVNPPVKDADYTISRILAEAFPTEVQELWAKYTQCFLTPQTMLNLTLTTNMSPTATPIVK
ncbi:MAG: hypothetical protein ACRD1V_17280 [Vicinamibacterales bacterium]